VGPPEMPPTTMCNSNATEGSAGTTIDNTNLVASPAPPGTLTPQTAPQILVYGFDDIENVDGITFVNTLLGSLKNPATNPNSMNQGATANLNPNACYAYDAAYKCGDGSLQSGSAGAAIVTQLLTTNQFGLGNHTIDHLEGYQNCSPTACATPNWAGIPSCWKNPDTTANGWLPCGSDTCGSGGASATSGPAAGNGPGACLDQATWQQILPANATVTSDYNLGGASFSGFRAPRLEMNDQGLQAIKALNYQYDVSLEEIQPPGWVSAAVDADTDSQKGFNWFSWPYLLDNGSPGVWNQQATGDKSWVTNFPTGLWELPVYEVYIPTKGGLGTTIANRMLAADMSEMPPAGTMANGHCFLSPGELSAGQAETEVTAFDFNTFVYCRMQPDEWLTTMEHTFLLRYYGSRTPLTYGAHPIEYSSVYDSYTLLQQPNNTCFRDVVNWNTYDKRQMAMQQFIQWIQSGPYAQDTWFMSFPDLVAFMQNPFDKSGNKVPLDTVASPDSNGIFSKLGWTGSGATINSMGGNSASITFTIATPAMGDNPAIAYVEAGLTAGALQNVSHIDIKYNTQVPFRIRLLTSDGSTTVTSLLAGVGGERLARIRMKDFFPGPEATEAMVASMPLVDSSYMAKVTGIAFESAATLVAPSGAPATFTGGTFTTNIEQITLHGVDTSSLCQ
jgi:hypothetical protein